MERRPQGRAFLGVARSALEIGIRVDSSNLDGGDDATLRLARTNLLDLKTDFAFWNPDAPSPSPAPVELDELPSTTATAEYETR